MTINSLSTITSCIHIVDVNSKSITLLMGKALQSFIEVKDGTKNFGLVGQIICVSMCTYVFWIFDLSQVFEIFIWIFYLSKVLF